MEEWEGVRIPIVPLDLLMKMKREAGREQDMADLEKLVEIEYSLRSSEHPPTGE